MGGEAYTGVVEWVPGVSVWGEGSQGKKDGGGRERGNHSGLRSCPPSVSPHSLRFTRQLLPRPPHALLSFPAVIARAGRSGFSFVARRGEAGLLKRALPLAPCVTDARDWRKESPRKGERRG